MFDILDSFSRALHECLNLASHHILWDMSSVLDQKRRIVLPRDIANQLGVAEGSKISFEKDNGKIILKKVGRKEDSLAQTMSWNPKRRGKLKPVIESEIKEIWD